MSIFDRDPEQIVASGKKALLQMTKHKVLLSPENFRVWFEYFMGSNGALSVDIDERVASGQPFTPEYGKDLYQRHFGGAATDDELLQKVNQETQKMLRGVFEQLMTTTGFTAQFGGKLEEYARELNTATELSQVQHVIVDMVKDTTDMAQSSRNLHEQLAEATARARALQQQLEETEREATIDPLTGLSNRKAYDEKVRQLHEAFKRDGAPFSTIMVDIDFFKGFNDKYGHRVGDEVLRQVARLMKGCLRAVDFPARYGGEEFVVLLPATKLNNAYIIAEQIRKRMGSKELKVIRTGQILDKVTVSVGIAEIHEGDEIGSVVERADQALYLAKNTGRDNVKAENDLAKHEEAVPQGSP